MVEFSAHASAVRTRGPKSGGRNQISKFAKTKQECLLKISESANCSIMLGMGKTFGEHLRALRESHGMTQRQLSRDSGVDSTTVHLLEMGERDPRPSHVKGFAKALQIPLSDLQVYADLDTLGLERAQKLTEHISQAPQDAKAARLADIAQHLHPEQKDILLHVAQALMEKDPTYRAQREEITSKRWDDAREEDYEAGDAAG